jgi:hypothetical protein
MAPDDRDRTFEKALARHLRSSVPSRPDDGALSGASSGLCPDPEMLAAYHDGSLSLEERNLWKQHVLSCENCQLVLAHLETPLDIPVITQADEEAAVLQPATPLPRAVAPARAPRPSPLHSLRWLWLVPAGAIAATLVAWISLHESNPQPLTAPSPVEVADNRQPSVEPPPAKNIPAATAERNEKASEEASERRTASSPAAAASAERDLASQPPQNQQQLSQQAPLQYAPNLSHGPSVNAQKQEQQINGAAGVVGGTLDLKKLDTQNAPKVRQRAVGDLAQPARVLPAPPPQPAPSLPPAEPNFLADQSLSAPAKDAPAKDKGSSAPAGAPSVASNAAAAKTTPANADAISAVTESVEVSGAAPMASSAIANERGMLRAAALKNPRVFWAPGGKQAWRLGPAGSLEHSKDKGVTWTPQISGVYTDLVAASAPSTKVCWIVGTAGTILLTTDGGTHWTKLESPVSNDLAAVRATDATHASISLVPDAQNGLVKTYQTSNGGRTWFSAPSDR